MPGLPLAQTRALDRRTVRSRARAIEATQALLAERGPAAITVEAVAERAGVARTTIYRNFGCLSDLIAAALDDLTSPPEAPDTGDVVADVTDILTGLDNALHHSAWGRLVPALLHAAEHNEQFADVQQRLVQRRRQTLLDVLRRGARQGRLPTDVDLDVLCDALAGTLYYRRLVTRRGPDVAAVAALVRHVLEPALRH